MTVGNPAIFGAAGPPGGAVWFSAPFCDGRAAVLFAGRLRDAVVQARVVGPK